MRIKSFLCVNLLLTVVETISEVQHNGHCEVGSEKCESNSLKNIDQKSLIFYTVNPPEGFNLRRDVYMRFAIMLAEAQKRREYLNWSLVLPPWHNMYHWRYESSDDPPQHWNSFFDVPSLKKYAPVYEMYEVMESSGRYGLVIDILYVLKHFDNAFENGVFQDKWRITGSCKYGGKFWGYKNVTAKSVLCVEFQGSISQILDIIDRSEKTKIMFANGEIPLHQTYGTKSYWDCRKSMKFNSKLIEAANTFISQSLKCNEIKCSNYLAIHWRRRDFVDTNRSASIKGTVKQIIETIVNKKLKVFNIFIASDGSANELNKLINELKQKGYESHIYPDNIDVYSEGQLAIIDQIICSRSVYFIGTHESTFTYRIQEEREILGFQSDTTFNRFCPDSGICEKPSRWTIVH